MSEVKTIKDVEPAVWAELKTLAERNNVPMGKMLGKMVRSYKEESKKFWNELFSRKPGLTDKEADEMLETLRELRSEKGFR